MRWPGWSTGREVAPLPFELACVPQRLYRWARMPVVSYAIPALVAIGQARFVHRPPRFPLTRLVRAQAMAPSLRVLERMQPESGGYLEAVPLTSFVTMSLAATGRRRPPGRAARPDVHSRLGARRRQLADRHESGDLEHVAWRSTRWRPAGEDVRRTVQIWTGCWAVSTRQRHPFTGAAPGGWGWTDLSGAVPDADDTAGALLALRRLAASRHRAREAVGGAIETPRRAARRAGCLDLQNRDGGWPTFCRGWGKLPFDRSGADLTAHALRALHGWRRRCRSAADRPGAASAAGGTCEQQQRADGSWVPLWFGHQDHPARREPGLRHGPRADGLRRAAGEAKPQRR